MAFDLLDQWIANLRARPHRGVAGNRPAAAVDSCFAGDGTLLYAGKDAWAGILDHRPPGPCTQRFPLHTTSRIEAGGPIGGDVFKCQRKAVDRALLDGTYGGASFSDEELVRLREIFPTGVCDWSKPDAGRPWWLGPHRRH